jgi:hypothetical protein
MIRSTLLLAALLALTAAPLAHAAAKFTAAEMSMQPRPDDAAQPAWTIHLNANGSGTYTQTPSRNAPNAAPIPLNVSAATLDRIALGEHAAHSGKCETHAKNIAQTGEKTIRYTAGATESCTFNYSDDANLMAAAATFEAIADTIQRGQRLQHELRYDRLGLDAEMEQLVAAQKNGSAIEIVNIAPMLQALVADDQVIDRVRRRAARLLQDAGASVPPRFNSADPADSNDL